MKNDLKKKKKIRNEKNVTIVKKYNKKTKVVELLFFFFNIYSLSILHFSTLLWIPLSFDGMPILPLLPLELGFKDNCEVI